jgi:hypothetical protein
VLLLNECLLLFISLSTQSGNFWIHSRILDIGIRAIQPSDKKLGECRADLNVVVWKAILFLTGIEPNRPLCNRKLTRIIRLIKVKVQLSLCLNKHQAMKTYWERYSSTHSLTSALDAGEWSASRPGRFTAGERAPGTHWIGGWVGPRAVLDTTVKRKIPSPPPGKRTREPRLDSPPPSAIPTEPSRLSNPADGSHKRNKKNGKLRVTYIFCNSPCLFTADEHLSRIYREVMVFIREGGK